MRRYAYLSERLKYTDHDSIAKIMLYEAEEGVYLFEYPNLDSIVCVHDRLYVSLEDLFDDWNDLIDDRGWIEIDDPMPYCQHDAFIPLRIKGRDSGNPEWGKYETLRDGKWVEYEMDHLCK